MAKDGTARGGPRIGQGRPKKPLAEKVMEGKATGELVLPDPVELEAVDVPPVKEYMQAAQKNGNDLCAAEVCTNTYKWLAQRGCEKYVNTQLIEQYAMAVSRWIQCEEAISEYGFLAKHPTTQAAIASPYVAMSREYMKQVTSVWYQINQVVREHCSVEYGDSSPQDDLMERLLQARGSR